MFDQDMTRAEVASALGESMATMSRWFQVWCEQGSAALGGARRSGPPGKLTPGQLARVEDALLAGPQANGFPAHGWSVERVAAVIERVTGVRCSAVTTWVVLRERLGWVPLATWVKPAAPITAAGQPRPRPVRPATEALALTAARSRPTARSTAWPRWSRPGSTTASAKPSPTRTPSPT
jgi:transposase